MRHPCVGDLTYGADPTLAARLQLGRQWLHARELGFIHPRIEGGELQAEALQEAGTVTGGGRQDQGTGGRIGAHKNKDL